MNPTIPQDTTAAANESRLARRVDELLPDLNNAYCFDCASTPAGACDDHLDDLDQADAYRDLAAELASALPQPPEEDRHRPRP